MCLTLSGLLPSRSAANSPHCCSTIWCCNEVPYFPVFGTISGLIVDCIENDKSPIHLLYCDRLLKYRGAHLTMLLIAEMLGDEGDVSMDIYGVILTSYPEKYLYQLTGMETGPPQWQASCAPPERWYGTDMGRGSWIWFCVEVLIFFRCKYIVTDSVFPIWVADFFQIWM